MTRAEIEAKSYDLKAVNPNRKAEVDERTPEQILDEIEAKGREASEVLSQLRAMEKTAATRGDSRSSDR